MNTQPTPDSDALRHQVLAGIVQHNLDGLLLPDSILFHVPESGALNLHLRLPDGRRDGVDGWARKLDLNAAAGRPVPATAPQFISYAAGRAWTVGHPLWLGLGHIYVWSALSLSDAGAQ